jgi:chromosome segregation ATPase
MIESLQREKTVLTEEATRLKEKNDTLGATNSLIEAELMKVRGAYDDAKEEISLLRERRETNIGDLDQQRIKIATLQDDIQKQETTIKVLKSNLRDLGL